jgi:preprotein translocase subunit SecB
MSQDNDVPASPAATSDVPAGGFVIGAQYIRDFSFEGPAHPRDVQGNEPPKIDVNVTAQTRPLEGTTYEVTLQVRAHATIGGKNAFLTELSYACIVTTPSGVSEDSLRYLLLAEVPRYLFPFAREIVANATRDGGFPPLLLQPIDFHALYQAQLQGGGTGAPAAGRA